MAKDTVRYPDEVVVAIEERVADGVFESKSEFYRFAAEYVLTLLDDEYDPETFAFDELRAELEVDQERHDADDETIDPFLATFAAVRQAALRGDFDAAEARIDEAYAPTDREALLLDEFLAGYRDDTPEDDAEAVEGTGEVSTEPDRHAARAEGTPDGGVPSVPREEGDAEDEIEGSPEPTGPRR